MAPISSEAGFIEICGKMSASELRGYLNRALDAFSDLDDETFPRRATTYDKLIEMFEHRHTNEILSKLSERLYGAVTSILDGRGEPWRKASVQSRLSIFNRNALVRKIAWGIGFGLGGRNLDQLQPGVPEFVIERIETSTNLEELFSRITPKAGESDRSGFRFEPPATGLRRSVQDELKIPIETFLTDSDLLALVKTVIALGDLRASTKEDVVSRLAAYDGSKMLVSIVDDLYTQIAEEAQFQKEVDQLVCEICGPISSLRDREQALMEQVEHSLLYGTPTVSLLRWELLPPGEGVYEQLESHFRRLERAGFAPDKPIDYTRLKKIEGALRPSSIHLGQERWNGYVVFGFNSTSWVILECPGYGNATYILKDNWQTISRLSKWEARHEHSDQVLVIRHTDSWFSRLRSTFRFSS